MAFHGILAAVLLVQVHSFPKFTWNITEVRERMREKMRMAPSCAQAKATDADWQNLYIGDKMRKICEQEIGCGGVTDIHVNADSYPYLACITNGDVEFQGLEPKNGKKQLDQQEACNNLAGKVTQTIDLSGSDGSTVTVATTSTAKFGEEIDIEVSIPDILKVTSKISFEFSSSHTNSQSESSTRSFSNSIQAEIPPHECVCGKEQVSTLVYDSTFTVPVCLSGWFRCDWYYTCNGHHFWYLWFDNFFNQDDLCYTVEGSARSNQAIKASAETDPGKCPLEDAIVV